MKKLLTTLVILLIATVSYAQTNGSDSRGNIVYGRGHTIKNYFDASAITITDFQPIDIEAKDKNTNELEILYKGKIINWPLKVSKAYNSRTDVLGNCRRVVKVDSLGDEHLSIRFDYSERIGWGGCEFWRNIQTGDSITVIGQLEVFKGGVYRVEDGGQPYKPKISISVMLLKHNDKYFVNGWLNSSIRAQLLGLFGKSSYEEELANIGYAQTFTVERVSDGDNLKLTNGERVRLIGIDAQDSWPTAKARRDSKRTGQDLETITMMGQEAWEFVEGLIKYGQEVRLEFDVQERDKYGRLLAYVFKSVCEGPELCLYEAIQGHEYIDIDGFPYDFINATIVKSGYATPMTIPPNVKYADLFKELYEEAREEKRGLWR